MTILWGMVLLLWFVVDDSWLVVVGLFLVGVVFCLSLGDVEISFLFMVISLFCVVDFFVIRVNFLSRLRNWLDDGLLRVVVIPNNVVVDFLIRLGNWFNGIVDNLLGRWLIVVDSLYRPFIVDLFLWLSIVHVRLNIVEIVLDAVIVVARLVMIVWSVGLSLGNLVVVEVTLNSELVSVGLKSDGVDRFSIWVLIVGEEWCGIHDWDEVLVDWWLNWSDLGSRVWVEVTVVKIDLINIVIQVVSVVASVRAKVVLNLVLIVLVGVALWEGLDLSQVAKLWRLVLGW